jgi:hypothetical protein
MLVFFAPFIVGFLSRNYWLAIILGTLSAYVLSAFSIYMAVSTTVEPVSPDQIKAAITQSGLFALAQDTLLAPGIAAVGHYLRRRRIARLGVSRGR